MLNKVLVITIVALALFSIVTNGYAQSLVPSWVKITAKWYGEGLISESEFLDSITFLINNNIIKLAETPSPEPFNLETSLLDESLVTKPRLNQCIQMHTEYKKLGEQVFREVYDSKNYLSACIELYKDPLWKYEGSDKISKLYIKFLDIREKEIASVTNPDEIAHAGVVSTVNLGEGKYLVKLNVCAGNTTLDKAKILVSSEIEAIQIGSSKNIPADSCRNYETQIFANKVENIKASIIEKVLEQ